MNKIVLIGIGIIIGLAAAQWRPQIVSAEPPVEPEPPVKPELPVNPAAEWRLPIGVDCTLRLRQEVIPFERTMPGKIIAVNDEFVVLRDYTNEVYIPRDLIAYVTWESRKIKAAETNKARKPAEAK